MAQSDYLTALSSKLQSWVYLQTAHLVLAVEAWLTESEAIQVGMPNTIKDLLVCISYIEQGAQPAET